MRITNSIVSLGKYSPSKGETAVRDCFLVLSANHVRRLANRGAVLKENCCLLYCLSAIYCFNPKRSGSHRVSPLRDTAPAK